MAAAHVPGMRPVSGEGKPAKAKKASKANRRAKTESKLLKLFFGKRQGK